MDDSSESLQAKLSQLADQLSNQSPTTEEALQLKTAMEDILEKLAKLSGSE